MKILFICSRNELRSPTAERIFADRAETDSAGLAPDAALRVEPDQLLWADLVVVMEKKHKLALTRRFSRYLSGTRIVSVDIPDRYDYMQPELVELLEQRMSRFLG